MKTLLALVIMCGAFDASADYYCVQTKDGRLICNPVVKTF
jgi:hypothetical protein